MTDLQTRIGELQTLINSRNAEVNSRIASFLQEKGEVSMPTLQALTEEKANLMQAIQETRDESNAVVEQLRNDSGALSLFSLGARVGRIEDFVTRAAYYVQNELPQEVKQKIENEYQQQDIEKSKIVAELQAKRDEELRTISVLQQRTSKRAAEMRNGPRNERGELGAKSRVAKLKQDRIDPKTEETKEYIGKAKCKKAELSKLLKELRLENSKLQAELLDEKHKNEKSVTKLNAGIRHAEIANTRDMRLCEQLNTGNAALTTNVQILLGQLNIEHYGISGAPEERELLTLLKNGSVKTATGASLNNNCRNEMENVKIADKGIISTQGELQLKQTDGFNMNGTPSKNISLRHTGDVEVQESLKNVTSQRERNGSFHDAVVVSAYGNSPNQQVSVTERSVPRTNEEAAAQQNNA